MKANHYINCKSYEENLETIFAKGISDSTELRNDKEVYEPFFLSAIDFASLALNSSSKKMKDGKRTSGNRSKVKAIINETGLMKEEIQTDLAIKIVDKSNNWLTTCRAADNPAKSAYGYTYQIINNYVTSLYKTLPSNNQKLIVSFYDPICSTGAENNSLSYIDIIEDPMANPEVELIMDEAIEQKRDETKKKILKIAELKRSEQILSIIAIDILKIKPSKIAKNIIDTSWDETYSYVLIKTSEIFNLKELQSLVSAKPISEGVKNKTHTEKEIAKALSKYKERARNHFK